MAEVSKFKNSVTGEEQDIKDATAREQIEELNETLTEFGGRNYLLNTHALSFDGVKTLRNNSSETTTTVDDEGYGVIQMNASSSYRMVGFSTGIIAMENLDDTEIPWTGRTFTFSCEVKGDLWASYGNSITFSFCVHSIPESGIGYRKYYYNLPRPDSSAINADTWTRVVITFTVPDLSAFSTDSALDTTPMYYSMQAWKANSTSAGTIWIRKPKLEMGTIPTDWSPSPDDIQELTVYDMGTEIPEGDDLNAYTDLGKYFSSSTAWTSTLSNTPSSVTAGFSLYVLAQGGGTYRTQLLIQNGDTVNKLFIRSTASSGWTNWFMATMTAAN